MSGRTGQRLRRDRRGGASVEFAMTSLILVTLVVGVVSVGSMGWVWQALQSTATDAARCAAVGSATCANVTTAPGNTKSYAVTAAQARGLQITTSNVSVSTGSVCGTSNMVQVSLTYSFSAIFPKSLPTSLTASACFPLPAA